MGLNLGKETSDVPTVGREWRPIVDPVVVDLFDVSLPNPRAPFTTIMSWKAYDPIEYAGQTYGQKNVEFAKFMELPKQTGAALELAVAGEGIPRRKLKELGWSLKDAGQVTRSFDSWRDYIAASSGEFSVCKNIFVATRSGFFSDRSAAYLACGRPVVMQETGFSDHLPCGRGLFAVRNVEEAAEAIAEIQGNYEQHSRWAREIAREYLDAERVLGRFLKEVGL